MLEYWDASSFDWTKEPYLSSALPVIQVNGWCVVVYYARLKQGSDPSFESSSKCCFLVWLRVSHSETLTDVCVLLVPQYAT